MTVGFIPLPLDPYEVRNLSARLGVNLMRLWHALQFVSMRCFGLLCRAVHPLTREQYGQRHNSEYTVFIIDTRTPQLIMIPQ